MKKLVSISLLFTLAACGGGCGGGGADGGSSSSAQISSNLSSPPTQVVKPVVNYVPTILSLAAGSYTVVCGRDDKPRTSATIKLSNDGLLTPWQGGVLDLKPSLLNFTRQLNSNPSEGLVGVFGSASGDAAGGSAAGVSISSSGRIGGVDQRPGAVDNSVLGDTRASELLGKQSPVASALSCDGAAEAAALATKSVYTAFAKYFDVPKTTLLCLSANSTNTAFSEQSFEPYEISNGELRFLGKTISLLTGFKKESIALLGFTKVQDSAGATIYKNSITYGLDRPDGTSYGLLVNEFGETTSLSYQVGNKAVLVCSRQ